MKLAAILGVGLWVSLAFGAPSLAQGEPNPAEDLRAELDKLRTQPDEAERWVQEAHLLFYLAEYLDAPEKQMPLYTEGRDLAKKARQVLPEDPGATLWWAANHGGIARLKKNFWALGALKDIEKALSELKERDPQFGYAAAARILGKIYLEAPSFVSIGSASKAKENLLDTLQRFPEFPGNQIGYAEYLVDDGEKEKAAAVVKQLGAKGAWDKGEFGDFRWEKRMWRQRFDNLVRKT